MPSYKFYKSERLTNKKRINRLFESGIIIKAFPLKLIYILEDQSEYFPPSQFAFTVPKRSFKKAVDRNFIKRRMKESFRLHKHTLYKSINEDKAIFAMIIFVGREKLEYPIIETSMQKILSKLIHNKEG